MKAKRPRADGYYAQVSRYSCGSQGGDVNDTTWEMIRPIASRLGAVIVLLVGLALLTGATETHTPSARTLANPTTTPESSDAAIASPLPAPTASPTPVPGNTSTPEPTPTAVPAIPSQFKASRDQPVHSKRGYSSDHGVLSPYVEPDPIDGAGRKLLAIYMVGSDLEEDHRAGSIDLEELLAGHEALPDGEEVEVIVAFGGARKDGWQGMKLANIEQLWVDVQDGQFGNETGADAYLYRADGAHMGDESSLKLFLDYLRDGYVNFDQRFLTFWDHGGSYLGFGNDTNFNSDSLSLDEIERAFQNSEPGRFDLIGFDASLMASVEVAKVIEPHAQYMIASQALEPGHGWFWVSVIEAFAQEDSIVEAGKRMVDDFVQNPLHADSGMPKTLSLLDLSEYDALISALDPVVSALGDQLLQNEAYSHGLVVGSHRAQTYGVDEREDSRVSIDLMHFAQLMAEQISDTELGASLDELMDAVDRFVIYSNHDGSKPNSFGIAIDAPENADAEYAAYKASDSWLDFQSVYADFLVADLEPPVVVREFSDTDGTFATVYDDNLAKVTTLYGFIQPVEYEDGTVEDFFMVVAEEEVFLTEVEDMYLASTWDQIWFTVEYDPEEPTTWIPAFFSGRFEKDGLEFIVFTAEIDYYQADKDYSGYEVPYDYATMSIIVYDDGESWEIVDHYVETYQFLFSGPDDEEGTVQFDKATYRLGPGDGVQFLNFGFSLVDEANDDWFYTGDGLVFFVQEPVFHFELLEFEDESDELIDYYYAIWAEDASGNWALGELVPSERVVDSPFGSMQVFRDPWNGFEVQVPQPWIEEEPDTAGFEVFVAYDPEGSGGVAIYVEDGIPVSLAEHADALEAWLIEAGAQDLTREAVETTQGLSAVLFEGAGDEKGFIWLAYLSDDGLAIDIFYSFSIDQLDAGRELAHYSFGTFLVDSPAPTADDSLLWQYETGNPDELVIVSALADGVVYAVSYKDFIYALNAESGDLLWKFESESDLYPPLTVAGGIVHAEGAGGELFALDAYTGERLRNDERVSAASLLSDGVRYTSVLGSDGLSLNVRAIDESSGELMWEADVRRSSWLPLLFPLTASGGNVYVSDADTVHALDSTTGKLAWSFADDTESPIQSPPLAADGVVFLRSYSAAYALDESTGEQVWRYEADIVGLMVDRPIVMADGIWFLAEDGGVLRALDAATGQLLWSYEDDYVSFISGVSNGMVFVTSGVADFYALDVATGKEMWSLDAGDLSLVEVTVVDGVLYAASLDGYLHTFDARTGEPIWSVEIGYHVGGTKPYLVSGGVVYVGYQPRTWTEGDGVPSSGVYAFTAPAPTNTPTATPTVAPTSTPTPTSVPTDKLTTEADELQITASTLWQEVFDILTASEQSCIRQGLGGDLESLLVRHIVTDDTEEWEVSIFSCLVPETARSIYLAGLIAALDDDQDVDLTEEHTACLEDWVAGIDVAAAVAADHAEDHAALGELMAGFVGCAPDLLIAAIVEGAGVKPEDLADEERECMADVIRATESSLLIGMMNQDADLAALQQWLGELSACAPALFVDAGNDEGDPPDDHGDDKDSATAIAVGADTQGSLDYEGDADFFHFTAAAGQFYEIAVALGTLEDAGINVVNLLDSTGEFLAHDNDEVGSRLLRVVLAASYSGDYYVQVGRLWGGEGSYTLTISLADIQDDHGNDADSATAIAVGADTQGSLDHNDDTDFFQFTASAGKLYQIDVALGTLENSDLALYDSYDSDGWTLASSDVGDLGASRIVWEAPDFGDEDYYVEVSNWLGGTGSYTLTVSLSDMQDDHGDHIETATAIEVETPVGGNVNYESDTDYFRFTATADQLYQIDVAPGTLEGSWAYLYDSGGVPLKAGSNVDVGVHASRIVWSAPVSGDYYVSVSSLAGSTGSYTLTISPSDIQDDHGDYIETATAMEVGTTVEGIVDYDGDIDLFRFTAAGQGYQIDVALGTLDHSVAMLLDSDGRELTSSQGDSRASRIVWTLPDSGYHYVAVFGLGGTGSYTLTISLSDIQDDHGNDIETATAMEVGTTVEGIVDYEGDVDLFRFTAAAGQGYQIDVALGSLDHSLANLLDADRLWLTSTDVQGGLAYRIVWEAPDSGDYYVEVSNWLGGIGSYTLTVTLR